MNAKKTIATIGLTGVLGLTTLGGITPAMAAEKGDGDQHKGNSVSQAAHNKEQGENNREAAHENAPGQQMKQWRATQTNPVVTAPVESAPETETPVDTAPKVDTPVTAPVEAPVTAPVTTPVEVAPNVDAPAGDVSTGDTLANNSLTTAPVSGDNVGEINPDLVGGLTLSGTPKFF